MKPCKTTIALGLAVPALFAAWKLWGPSVFNHYDDLGDVSSLKAVCIFCRKVHQRTKVLYEDEEVFVMHDDFPKSTVHLLVLSKRHIKNTAYLRSSDYQLLQKMITIGELLARELVPAAELK